MGRAFYGSHMRISVVGSGKLGTSLSKVWHDLGTLKITDVVNQSFDSSRLAVQRIGAGNPLGSILDIRCSDLIMIATSDSIIRASAEELASNTNIKEGTIIFHCSGALSSLELESLKSKGMFVCSAHPVKSFSSEIESLKNISGTSVALEGDVEALQVVRRIFKAIGGIPFEISVESKTLYHAAISIVSNFLPPLLEAGFIILKQIGIADTQAKDLVEPLVRGTIDNIFKVGTVEALTGPISRGDYKVVESHLCAMKTLNLSSAEQLCELYSVLGRAALELVRQKGIVENSKLNMLSSKLNYSNP